MRELLPISYAIIGLGMLFVVTHVRAGRRETLSFHAASKPLTYRVFGISLTIGIFFLTLYALGWLIPHYQLPLSFLYAYLFGALSVVAVAWIPDMGEHKRAHLFAAYCVLASQGAIIGLLLVQARLSILAWVGAWLMLMLMLLVSYGLFFKARARQQMLILELILFFAFPAALMAVSYL